MAQFDFGILDPYVADGVALADDLNHWRDAVHSMHRGASRPSYVVAGMLWINDSGGPTNWLVNVYLGTTQGDRPLFSYNTSSGAITMQPAILQAATSLIAPLLIARPTLRYEKADNAADLKNWSAAVQADGRLRLTALSDAGATQFNFDFRRDGVLTGTTPLAAALANELVTAAWVRSLTGGSGGGGSGGAPAVQVLTTGVGLLYTPAAGVKWLRAIIKGGGSAIGTAGGTSSFGGISAAGGGANGAGGSGGAGSAAWRTPGAPGGMGDTVVGGSGGGSGGGLGGSTLGTAALASSGGGAGGNGPGTWGGGEGETAVAIFPAPLLTNYTYTVGTPGDPGSGLPAGGSGKIVVEAYS